MEQQNDCDELRARMSRLARSLKQHHAGLMERQADGCFAPNDRKAYDETWRRAMEQAAWYIQSLLGEVGRVRIERREGTVEENDAYIFGDVE